MSNLVGQSEERLRAQGGRMTAQRRLILATLETLADHPTAEELYALVRQEDASLHLSTVYRTLRWLEQEDLVSARFFNEERRQERFDPAYPSEHHHFMCSDCRNVIEFDSGLVNQIKAEFARSSGAQVETASITLYGLCPDCQARRHDGLLE